jgi:hypothetical protein
MQTVVVKGMVQLSGVTYRIARLDRGVYEVVRLLDDVRVGTFVQSGPGLDVFPEGIELHLLREIARTAIQKAKTSWVGRLNLS